MVYPNPLDTTPLKTTVPHIVSLTVFNTTRAVVVVSYLSTDLDILLPVVVRYSTGDITRRSEGGNSHSIKLLAVMRLSCSKQWFSQKAS